MQMMEVSKSLANYSQIDNLTTKSPNVEKKVYANKMMDL